MIRYKPCYKCIQLLQKHRFTNNWIEWGELGIGFWMTYKIVDMLSFNLMWGKMSQ